MGCGQLGLQRQPLPAFPQRPSLFCTLGQDDFRITTRVVPGQPFSAYLATAHEWGHSLYEHGLPRRGDHYFPWPLGEATSMGVHESQSLFWECRVARGEAFAGVWISPLSLWAGRRSLGRIPPLLARPQSAQARPHPGGGR